MYSSEDCVIVPTIGGRCQRHPNGMVGHLFRIKNPDTVRIGDCFMNGRLKSGDLCVCVRHSGNCFQDYIIVFHSKVYNIEDEDYGCWVDELATSRNTNSMGFGSYGMGDADKIALTSEQFDSLKAGIEIKNLPNLAEWLNKDPGKPNIRFKNMFKNSPKAYLGDLVKKWKNYLSEVGK